jgi:hypothetical protein
MARDLGIDGILTQCADEEFGEARRHAPILPTRSMGAPGIGAGSERLAENGRTPEESPPPGPMICRLFGPLIVC